MTIMTRFLTVCAASAITLFLAIVFVSQPAVAQDAADIDTSGIPDMSIGNPDSVVTVIEYASFTCPHCAAFHTDAFKDLKADYIDTDKINYIYREVYFDRFGLWAAIVARCGDGAENRYFGIADMLYSQQQDWARQSDAAEIVGRLRRIGKTAGLSDGQLDQCLTDADNAQTLYARYLQQAEADGITSTPSFLINGEKYTNMSYDEMKAIIDQAIGS
ncbi:MAG: DsbA family protein [Boseongicola sp.]